MTFLIWYCIIHLSFLHLDGPKAFGLNEVLILICVHEATMRNLNLCWICAEAIVSKIQKGKTNRDDEGCKCIE